MNQAEKIITDALSSAGIEINGGNPWDIQIKDSKAFHRVFYGGSVGIGESYVDGLWDSDQIDELAFRAMSSNLPKILKKKNSS